MKKTLIAAAALALVSTPCFAQTFGGADTAGIVSASIWSYLMGGIVLSLAGWLVTVIIIFNRQSGAACVGLFILALFLWPLALIVSLCLREPQPTVVYHLAPGQAIPAEVPCTMTPAREASWGTHFGRMIIATLGLIVIVSLLEALL